MTLPGGLDGRRFLLLQGPIGPFFTNLAHDLRAAGAFVRKVNFNGGDWVFARRWALNYRGEADMWPDQFEAWCSAYRIDSVVLFGDCRPLHRAAKEKARELGLRVYVFEEGYVRPDYVTLEEDGVNGHTQLPASPIFYLNSTVPALTPPQRVGQTIWHAGLWALIYYWCCCTLTPFFWRYVHHRRMSLFETLHWWRSFLRKAWYKLWELPTRRRVESAERFFLVPLQVHNDAQLAIHSSEGTIEDFIAKVVHSFRNHAPAEAVLVIKHHPMDRGYVHYGAFIRRCIREAGLDRTRVLYLHDAHLPTLLARAEGVVTINSTVGMSALHHSAPVKTLGKAYYDLVGLTYQGPLDRFWQEAVDFTVNGELYQRFRAYVVERTQINGSFYKRLPGGTTRSGLRFDRPAFALTLAESTSPGHVSRRLA